MLITTVRRSESRIIDTIGIKTLTFPEAKVNSKSPGNLPRPT